MLAKNAWACDVDDEYESVDQDNYQKSPYLGCSYIFSRPSDTPCLGAASSIISAIPSCLNHVLYLEDARDVISQLLPPGLLGLDNV